MSTQSIQTKPSAVEKDWMLHARFQYKTKICSHMNFASNNLHGKFDEYYFTVKNMERASLHVVPITRV